MSLRIVFLINHLSGSGGAQKAAISICTQLARKGYVIDLIALDGRSYQYLELDENIRLRQFWTGPRKADLRPVRAFTKLVQQAQLHRLLIRGSQPKVIVSFTTGASMAVLPVVSHYCVPVIASERNALPRHGRDHQWHDRILQLYKKATLVTSNSLSVLRYLEANGIRQTFHTPNPYFLPTAFKQKEECVKPIENLLAVGGLREQKGFDVLLKAFAHSAFGGKPDVRLTIIGEGALRADLEQLAIGLGISEQIDWLGVVNDVTPHYLAADALILPSRWEGVPNVLLEALGAGVPCIASDIPGVREYVEPGCHALTFQSENHADLARQLDAIALAGKLRSDLSNNGRELAAKIAENNSIDCWVRAIDVAQQQFA